jgi:group I intron endonuclease
MAEYKIYRITCSVTGGTYVGRTTQTLRRRFDQHCYLSEAKPELTRLAEAMNVYGLENFGIELLGELWGELTEAKFLEDFALQFHSGAVVYNTKSCGERELLPPESLAKIRAKTKGVPCPAKRKPKPEGFGAKVSAATKGVPKSKEQVDKMKETQKRLGRTSPVIVDGLRFESAREAEVSFGIARGNFDRAKHKDCPHVFRTKDGKEHTIEFVK